MSHVDHCKTADDVWAAHRAVMSKRRASYKVALAEIQKPKPVKSAAPLAAPTAVTDIHFDGHIWTGGFNFLVHSAYPVTYPDRVVQIDTVNAWQPEVGEIIRCVAAAAGITVNDITSECRTLTCVIPRHLAIALAKRLTSKSLPNIGRIFGGRDHTTVLYAIHRMAPVITATVAEMPPNATLNQWAETALKLTKVVPLNKPTWRRAQARSAA